MSCPERAAKIVHMLATDTRAVTLWLHLIYGTSMMTGANYANYCRTKSRARANGLTIMQQRKAQKKS